MKKPHIVMSLAFLLSAIVAPSIAAAQVSVSEGGTGLASIPTGALLYGNETSPLATLYPGTDGQALSLVNGVPTWVFPLSLSDLHLLLNTQGDLRLGQGISTQIGYYPSTVIGTGAYANGGGYGHTVMGWDALGQLTGGEWDIALGAGAGADLGHGAGNTFVGGSAGTVGNTHQPWSGNFNTFIGFAAASNISPTSPILNNNTIVGSYAADGQTLSGGEYNILLGSHLNLPLDGGSYQVNIGNILFGTNISGTGYAVSPGRIGIGTVAPEARFTIQANDGETNNLLFSIDSKAGNVNTSLYTVDTVGHHVYGGQAPTLTACGSGATVVGNDNRGRISVGSGSGATCTLLFAHAWHSAPVCQVTKESGPFRDWRISPSSTAFVITASAGIGKDVFAYSCDGF